MDIVDCEPEELVERVAEEPTERRVRPAQSAGVHIGDEDPLDCALEDRRVAPLRAEQRLLRLPALRDIRDRAEHGPWSPLDVELERPAAVDPTRLARVLPHDPVLALEWPAEAEHLTGEVRDHRVAISGVDQRGPAVNRAVEGRVDAEDPVETRGARPAPGSDIERVPPKAGDRLDVVDQPTQLARIVVVREAE